MKTFLSLVALGAFLLGGLRADDSPPALKDVFAGKFLIGAAIGADVALQADHPLRPLVEKHFNSLVPANLMKWGPYNPKPGEYNDAAAEAYFAYGRSIHCYMVGHCLFWHAQTPKWVFEDGSGKPASRELLLQRMRERVRRVSRLYGSRTDAWDVVNEAIIEDGTLRDTAWHRILGEDFLPEAFRIAGEELPKNVKLLYNDYNMETPGRLASVVKLVHDLRARGLRIDAVGSQAHWRLETPTIAEIEASIVALRDAGVKVHFTELDIEVLPRRANGAEVSLREGRTPENDPYTAGLPPEIQEKLARRYADIFTLFLKYADVIERVTFWGVTDGDSWLNGWPVRGRTNHPLLFDRAGQPKPAFDAVIQTAKKP
ncbi:MAG TPA: endo-1,4-beta-xylanase [Lacunisphaera sp.]